MGALGQQITRSGDALAQIATHMQHRDNLDMVFRARTAVGDEYLKAKQEWDQRVGRNAKGLTAEAEDWWAEAERRHSESLTNDSQKQAFAQYVAQMRQSSVGTVSNFEAAQLRKSIVDSATASVANHINFATTHSNNPEAVAYSRERMLEEVGQISVVNGETDAQLTQRRETALNDLHGQMIDSLIDAKPAEAKAYYEANKDEITGAMRTRVEKALEIGSRKEQAQTMRDHIIDQGMTRSEALDYVRENASGEAEDMAMNYVNVHFNQQDAERNERYRQASDQAYTTWAANNYDLSAVPTATLNAMEPSQRYNFERIAADVSGNPLGPQTDWDLYENQMRMARERPNEFAQQDPNPVRAHLGRAERAVFDKLYQDLRGGVDPFKTSKTFEVNKVLDPVLDSMGLTTQGKGMMRTAVIQEAVAAGAYDSKTPWSAEQWSALVDNVIDREFTQNRALYDQYIDVPESQTQEQHIASAKKTLEVELGRGYGKDQLKFKLKEFESIAAEAFRAYTRETGQPPDEQERQTIIEKLLRKGHIPRDWRLDPKGYYFELNGEPDWANFVEDE